MAWSADYMLSGREDIEVVRYNTVADLIMALRFKQIDKAAMERPFAFEVLNCVGGLKILDETVATDALVFAVNNDREDLLNELNEFFTRFKDSEEKKDIFTRLNSDEGYEYRKIENIKGNRILSVGLPTDAYPYSYIDFETGEYGGSDMEVITLFANEYGYTLEFYPGIFTTIEIGIGEGEFDVAIGSFCNAAREDAEAAEVFMMSDIYMEHEIVYIEVEDFDSLTVISPPGLIIMNSFFDEIYKQIYVTFIYENRWRFFLDGLWMTLLLTFSSFILGTLLGILFCRLKMSKSALLRKISDLITSLFIQIPTMVLLMLFVYVIFGSSSLPVVLIVIICLTIKTASYMSDIFYTSVNTVNKGEIEAARTLGMNRYQAFFNVMLPQAVDNVLPVYKNQFISTLQETSVVGYIAIMDLTRASDIVSSRTFDAMFALIAVTLIYLVIGWSVSALIGVLMKRKHAL